MWFANQFRSFVYVLRKYFDVKMSGICEGTIFYRHRSQNRHLIIKSWKLIQIRRLYKYFILVNFLLCIFMLKNAYVNRGKKRKMWNYIFLVIMNWQWLKSHRKKFTDIKINKNNSFLEIVEIFKKNYFALTTIVFLNIYITIIYLVPFYTSCKKKSTTLPAIMISMFLILHKNKCSFWKNWVTRWIEIYLIYIEWISQNKHRGWFLNFLGAPLKCQKSMFLPVNANTGWLYKVSGFI